MLNPDERAPDPGLWPAQVADDIEDCDPFSCTDDGHVHCANADCANPNQESRPPGYSPFCQECDPRNLPDRQEVYDEIGE